MNDNDLHEMNVRELTEQLYSAYKRIAELQAELQAMRESNGNTAREDSGARQEA